MDGPLIELSLCDNRYRCLHNRIFSRQYVTLLDRRGECAVISVDTLFYSVSAVADIGRARID